MCYNAEGKDYSLCLLVLKIHEKNYQTHDIVSPDVVLALNILRHYSYGVLVDIFNNHKSILEHNMRQRR